MKKARAKRRRRLIVPEVVQISNMDCGPASLKCLLEGFGVAASYGRLREVCQTEVDGTSINAIEDAAVELGLSAEQVLLPADHLVLPEGESLPAIVVIRLPGGATHFVVVWRRHGGLLQIMDPAGGRRWVPVERFMSDLHVHAQAVSATAWRRWAGSDEATRVLRSQMAVAGISDLDIEAIVGTALADDSWRSIAALEAAARMTHDLVRSGALRTGKSAARVLRKFFERALEEESEGRRRTVPDAYWSVQPARIEGEAQQVLAVRGVVFIRVRGLRGERALEEGREIGEAARVELSGVLSEREHHTLRRLVSVLREDGLFMPAVVALAVTASAGALLVEGLLLRGLLEVGSMMAVGRERLGAAAVLVGFLILTTGLEQPVIASGFRMGRRLEAKLRLAFLRRIPQLRDRYFQSRLVSDMVERCHSVHVLRTLPPIAIQLLRSGATLVALTAGIIWLDPSGAWVVMGIAVCSVLVPALGQSVLAERDLRLRSHAAALVRFYLDGMLGLLPIRALGAERVVRREHEGMLVQWMRSALGVARAQVSIEAGLGLVTLTLIGVEMHHLLIRSGSAGDALLVVYWVLMLPTIGQELAGLLRLYPAARNTAQRLFEPMGEEEALSQTGGGDVVADAAGSGPVSIRFKDVNVRAGGHSILEQVTLAIAAGSHVAIVGPSGAGKTTLVGLLLGWHEAREGSVAVDGTYLSEEATRQLRRKTAWIDPSVQIWNRNLIDNLRYGNEGAAGEDLSGAMEAAGLRDLVATLPEGMQTRLGENGATLSGGEGQRVRFGRALLRRDARLVIMDEPFRGLDRGQRRGLLAAARRWWSRATLICITHDVQETQAFDRVVVLEKGRVVEEGSPAELAARTESVYAAMLRDEERLGREVMGSAEWRRMMLRDGALTAAPQQEGRT